MKRTSMVIVVLFILAGMLVAQPSYWGSRGLFRTISADNQGRGYLSLSLYGHGYYANSERQLQNDETEQMSTRMVNGYLSASFAPFNFIELSGGAGMVYLYNKDIYLTSNHHYEVGFGDSYAGLKLSASPFWWLNVGGYGYTIFPTGGADLKDSLITSQETAFGGMGLLTFDLINPKAHFPLPLRIHINTGIHKGNRTDATGANDDLYDYLLLRGGIEIPAGAFDLFADFSTEKSMSDIDKLGDAMRITPGIRFNASGASMNIGCEIGLGDRGVDYMSHGREFALGEDDTMKIPWKIVFGLTFDTRLIKEQPVPIFADVTGSVSDVDAGTFIIATVKSDDTTVAPVVTGPDGIYRIRLGMGAHNLSFSANGYETQSKSVVVKDSAGIPLDVKLRPLVSYGRLTGRVSNMETGEAMGGTIIFADPNIEHLNVEPTTGAFEKELATGSYAFSLEVEGFYKASEVAVIEKGKTIQKDIKLRPLAKTTGAITGNIADSKTGAGLAANISVLEGGFEAATSAEGTGTYNMTLPVGTFNLRIEKNGYLPTTQTIVIKPGETAVQKIELTPVPQASISGKVINTKDKMPLAATISLPGSNIGDVSADENGIFIVSTPPGTYTVKADFPGFIPQAFPVVAKDGETTIQNFELIKAGEKITLTGVYFDFDKATIKPESRATLDQAIKIMVDNPGIRVRIEGHTDSKGADDYNLNLSQRRADSVKAYLVQNGAIEASRIVSLGKGETEPIASNDTEEGRSLNRRIEFIVLE